MEQERRWLQINFTFHKNKKNCVKSEERELVREMMKFDRDKGPAVTQDQKVPIRKFADYVSSVSLIFSFHLQQRFPKTDKSQKYR